MKNLLAIMKHVKQLPENVVAEKLHAYIEKHNMHMEVRMLDYLHIVMGPLAFFYGIDHVFGINELSHHWLIYTAYFINRLAQINFTVGFYKQTKW